MVIDNSYEKSMAVVPRLGIRGPVASQLSTLNSHLSTLNSQLSTITSTILLQAVPSP